MYNWLLSVLDFNGVYNDYILVGAIAVTISIVLIITNMFFSIFTSIFKRY